MSFLLSNSTISKTYYAELVKDMSNFPLCGSEEIIFESIERHRVLTLIEGELIMALLIKYHHRLVTLLPRYHEHIFLIFVVL